MAEYGRFPFLYSASFFYAGDGGSHAALVITVPVEIAESKQVGRSASRFGLCLACSAREGGD